MNRKLVLILTSSWSSRNGHHLLTATATHGATGHGVNLLVNFHCRCTALASSSSHWLSLRSAASCFCQEPHLLWTLFAKAIGFTKIDGTEFSQHWWLLQVIHVRLILCCVILSDFIISVLERISELKLCGVAVRLSWASRPNSPSIPPWRISSCCCHCTTVNKRKRSSQKWLRIKMIKPIDDVTTFDITSITQQSVLNVQDCKVVPKISDLCSIYFTFQNSFGKEWIWLPTCISDGSKGFLGTRWNRNTEANLRICDPGTSQKFQRSSIISKRIPPSSGCPITKTKNITGNQRQKFWRSSKLVWRHFQHRLFARCPWRTPKT